jgi:DNA topoisomerase-6 subunit B
MSRGQQGIGISAAGMYGLITTGKPVRIISKTSPRKPASEVILKMDTSKNRADVVHDQEHPEDNPYFDKSVNGTGTGTRVEIELQGKYLKGARSVDEYVQLTAIANPHATLSLRTPPTSALPEGEYTIYERTIEELPDQPEEIKPHPHGIELGTLISMLERTSSNQLGGFFKDEFCRIGPKVAQQVADNAGLTTRSWVKNIGHKEAEKLYEGLQQVKVMGPPTNCLSPIGVRTMLKGLQQGLTPDFITASSRPPAVYRGRPFIIEAGIAFGGDLPSEESARVYRFANRVPLQYQQSACSSFKAVTDTNWRGYNLQQPRGGLPVGPMIVMIHMASVWVPFTSESKEAIADYDEIRKEMKLALQECGRKLGAYLRRRQKMKRQGERRGVFLRYIGEISKACHHLTGTDQQALYDKLMATAEQKTAEFDAKLDEEGRFVKNSDDRLSKDETVFIRRDTAAAEGKDDRPVPRGADIDLDAAADEREAEADNGKATGLFGQDDDEPTPKPKRKKKVKVRRKVKAKR